MMINLIKQEGMLSTTFSVPVNLCFLIPQIQPCPEVEEEVTFVPTWREKGGVVKEDKPLEPIPSVYRGINQFYTYFLLVKNHYLNI